MTATYLGTQNIPLDELTPFPGNARRGNIAAIRTSLRRNGQYRSLIVREIPNGGPRIVLAGNHTLRALDAEGHTTARCELILCDDETARRINLADNKIPEDGDYDRDALAELLSYLDGDYEGTGYTEDDIFELITPPPPLPPEGDAPINDTQPVWGVIIECDGEQQQIELLERLAAEGRKVRALTV